MQGVVGVYSGSNATLKTYYNLFSVQHRGQESAGISAAGDHSIRTYTDEGMVMDVLGRKFVRSFIHPSDYAAIGCVSNIIRKERYTTPFELESKNYKISLAMDGLILGHKEHMNETIFGRKFLKKLEKTKDADIAAAELMKELDKAYYSLVMLINDKNERKSELIAARDSRGVRPLYMGRNTQDLYVASESPAIDILESMGEHIAERRDVRPGEMLRQYGDGLYTRQVLEPRPAHCAFEWVYFGRMDSVVDGRWTHEARKELGHLLVKTHRLKKMSNAITIPIPDSGRSMCTGVAKVLGLTADEGVYKNPYMGRTYMRADPKFRKISSDIKHNPIRTVIRGKTVFIYDDSIVRGTVSESTAKALRHAGAKKVIFSASYAPILYPCFSDPKNKPLAAAPYAGMSIYEIGRQVAKKLPSIDQVKYNSRENVIKAIGLPDNCVCTMCAGGKNPFED